MSVLPIRILIHSFSNDSFKLKTVMKASSSKMVFWEKQMDRMCGVHCINAVLQGSA